MSNTVYEVARRIKMPGVEVQATFHPHKLSKRIFNASKKMIETGVINGWGASAQVARFVFSSHHVGYVSVDKWHVAIRGGWTFAPTDEIKERVTELHNAWLLVETVARGGFDQTHYREYLDNFLSGKRSHLALASNKEITEQIAELVAYCRSERDLAESSDLAARFVAGESFPVSVIY